MADKNNHTFNVEFASRYGIEEALIFGDIYYWCIKNKENDINLKKGSDGVERYYTYNSTAALQDSYKYMTLTKVYRVIGKLEKEGLIITGCFNKRVGDRTRWYAVTEKGEQVYTDCVKFIGSTLYDLSQLSKCNLQNETDNLQNETDNLQNEMTLPNSNTDTNTNTKTNSNKPEKKTKRKTKTEERLEHLSSLSEQTQKDSKLLTDFLYNSRSILDENFKRTKEQLIAWQVEFADFLVSSGRSINEIMASLKWALSDTEWKWRTIASEPSGFIRNYEKIFLRSANQVNPVFKSQKQTFKRPGGSKVANILEGMEEMNA